MAEFCKECYISICGGNENDKIKLSKELDLCEGCGQYKQVVVSARPTLNTFIREWKVQFQYKKSKNFDE